MTAFTESRPEMGAPYPQHRGGTRAPDDQHTIVHPAWPARAPASLSRRVEQAARDFDKIIRDYNRST